MSDTSQITAALQKFLVDTEPDPAGLFDLTVRHCIYPAAAEVLYNHAEGSFPSLVAVYAGSKHAVLGLRPWVSTQKQNIQRAARDFDAQVTSLAFSQFAHATETDLLESIRTVRSGLLDESPDSSFRISLLFAMRAPLEALTDRVTAEMSWWSMKGLSPELGAGPPDGSEDPPIPAGGEMIRWLMSRYLCNRFGEHGPSWEMFKNLCKPPKSIGETANTVAYLHTRFGEHGPSWEMFAKVHDPSQTLDDTANLVVAVQHG